MSLRQQLLEIRERQVQLLADIDQLLASVPSTDNSPIDHVTQPAAAIQQSTSSPLARKCVNQLASDLNGMEMSASSLEYLQRYNLLPSSDQRSLSSPIGSADNAQCQQAAMMKPCYLATDHTPFKENDETTRILNCDDIRRLPKL